MMARTSRDPGEGKMDMDTWIGYAYENGVSVPRAPGGRSWRVIERVDVGRHSQNVLIHMADIR